jgi:uncharacterized protein (DUF697 family)
MRLDDPTATPTFLVRILGDAGVGKSALAAALLNHPVATDEELARLRIDDGSGATDEVDAAVLVVRGAPDAESREELAKAAALARTVLVAVHARDLDRESDVAVRDAWEKLVAPSTAHLTATPKDGAPLGIDELRAALLGAALAGMDLPVERARRARRPYATAIVSAAVIATAAEAFLPGAAAFIVATQVGAITGLYYLYTGKWMGRAHALGLVPAFAGDAAGTSAFLIAKSFLPPTGVADAVAAAVATSMTIAMLGTITYALERGYSLDQRDRLMIVFKRLRAKTRAERAKIVRARHLWNDKAFWTDMVRRIIFD